MRHRAWLVVVAAAIVGAGTAVTLPGYLLDGVDGWVVASLGSQEDTEYAAGYSDEAFRRVRLGMATPDVMALLGPPLERAWLAGAKETWRWSRGVGDRTHRVRAVIFEMDRVVEIRNELSAD